MLPSVLVNIVCAVCALAAIGGHCKNRPLRIVLRYFTSLSNLFCALVCLAVAACRLFGAAPGAVLVLKYVATAAVAVTFVTVMCFLGPVVYDYKMMLSGPDLWLHLVCPVLAIVSLLLWDRPGAGFRIVLLGAVPVLLYTFLYLYHVILAPEEKRWKDFYGFNRGGRWYLSFIAMLLAALLISFILWIV